MIAVRRALDADIPAMSAVLTASITDLCAADHRNDPMIVARWTANKTPDGVRGMLLDPRARLFVAESDGDIAAVGSIIGGDRVGLNYVAPAHRFRGVSKALLAAMEQDMCRRDVAEATLEATMTAHRFYRDAGWRDAGPPQDHGGLTCQPMTKHFHHEGAEFP